MKTAATSGRPDLPARPVPIRLVEAGQPLAERWYQPLLKPVRRPVEKVLQLLARSFPELLAAGLPPRAGLASALLFRVSSELGSRRPSGRALRDAATWFEFYNAKQFHRGARFSLQERRQLFRFHLDRASRLWKLLRRFDDAHGHAVLDLAIGAPERLSGTLWEGVEWLRAVAAAAALLGRIALPELEACCAQLSWLGQLWEHRLGSAPAPSERPIWLHPLAESCCRAADNLLQGSLPSGPRQLAHGHIPSDLSERLAPLLAESEPAPLLAGLQGCQRSQLSGQLAPLQPAVDMLVQQPGKRLRARLCLAAAEAVSPGARVAALPAAAAVESLHRLSLLIDDVIDAAPMRRHQPCLHRLTGPDFALAFAGFALLRLVRTTAGWPTNRREPWLQAVESLAEGERLEVRNSGDFGLGLPDCAAINGLKTARLFETSMRLGALAAGADAGRAVELARFGFGLGQAFQIVDDLLDYTGEAGVLGKQPGIDLRSGKLTVPLALLRDSLARRERRWLQGVFEAAGDATTLARIQRLMRAHRIPEQCRERARRWLTAPASPALEALAQRCLERLR